MPSALSPAYPGSIPLDRTEKAVRHILAAMDTRSVSIEVAALAFAGPALWMRLINDKSNIDTGYYLYLTSAYKECKTALAICGKPRRCLASMFSHVPKFVKSSAMYI